MTKEFQDLIEEFLLLAYPVKMMKLKNPALVRHNLPVNGKFKRVIFINDSNVFRMSDKSDQLKAMQSLVSIVNRVFRQPQSEITPIVKRHLHINGE
jgi:hypothetical protein